METHRRPDSASSTPYESAACSPSSSTDRAMSCFFSNSRPTCPVKVTLNIESATGMSFMTPSSIVQFEEPGSDDFDFSARFSEGDQPWSPAPMSSADELFCNGQIRPLWYTREDLRHFYSAHSDHTDDDDGTHFDFQSSADYKFTMLALHQSTSSTVNELPQYVGYGFNSDCHNQDLACVYGAVSHVRTDDVIEKEDWVQKTAESLPRQTSRRKGADMVAKHVMKLKMEECRGRRAGGSSIRRSRSLSPLRVFHMDDEGPRQSIDHNHSLKSAHEDNGSAEKEEKREGDEMMARRKGVRLTLKDLLHASEQAEQVVVYKRQACLGTEQQRKAHMETGCGAFRSKSSLKNRLEDSMKGPKHVSGVQGPRPPQGPHYSSPKVQSEQMRRQTFLPYRHGVFACLGFTSKNYHSVAGIRSLHSKSQGMR